MAGAISKSRLRAGAATLVALAAILVLQAALAQRAQPRFPTLTGRIVDEAQLLSSADKAALERELAALEQKSTDQLVIYTARSLQGYEIEDLGYQLGRAWAIGQKDKNNGVILIVAPKERKVRIEVGRGLEPQFTDALSKLIIENAILPAFRRGDFAAGIKAGVHDIRDVLLGDAEAVKERAKRSAPRPWGGGGFALAFLIAFMLLGFIIVWSQAHETAHPSRVARDRRGRNAERRSSDWGSGAGSWSGSGSSGDSGGFSGGGGDFGGGGASGSW
jgi:uncharacterized protein